MKTILASIIIIAATVAAAAPATTNRVATLKPSPNRVQIIAGKPVAKGLLKTQPRSAVRVKDAEGRTRDLPIMFSNNKIKPKKKGEK